MNDAVNLNKRTDNMKVYILVEMTDDPYGVEVQAVYSTESQAVDAFHKFIFPYLEPSRSFEDYKPEYILEFELDSDPQI